jgi:hypothetical protein
MIYSAVLIKRWRVKESRFQKALMEGTVLVLGISTEDTYRYLFIRLRYCRKKRTQVILYDSAY